MAAGLILKAAKYLVKGSKKKPKGPSRKGPLNANQKFASEGTLSQKVVKKKRLQDKVTSGAAGVATGGTSVAVATRKSTTGSKRAPAKSPVPVKRPSGSTKTSPVPKPRGTKTNKRGRNSTRSRRG